MLHQPCRLLGCPLSTQMSLSGPECSPSLWLRMQASCSVQLDQQTALWQLCWHAALRQLDACVQQPAVVPTPKFAEPRVRLQGVRIDYALCTPGLLSKVVSCEMESLPPKWSDHAALVLGERAPASRHLLLLSPA